MRRTIVEAVTGTAIQKKPQITHHDIVYAVSDFIKEEWGNDATKLATALTGVLRVGKVLTKNEKIHKAIDITTAVMGSAVLGFEIYSKIKTYVNTTPDTSEYQTYMANARNAIDYENDDITDDVDDYTENKFDSNIVKWLISTPKTSKISIIKHMKCVNGVILVESKEKDQQSGLNDVFLVCQINETGYRFGIRLRYVEYNTVVIVETASMLGLNLWKQVNDVYQGETVYNTILKDYINSLDISANTIRFDNGSAIPVHRRTCPIQVNQYDVAYLTREIDVVLKASRRRAIALAGKAGVGKSSIIRYIEQECRQYMIIHLSPADFRNPETLINRFDIIKTYQPVILVIEDIDSCKLDAKNEVVGTFLDLIDEVNKDLSIYIIVTVNSTGAVNKTLIDRPGRFDRIDEVLPPQTYDDVSIVYTNKMGQMTTAYYTEEETLAFASLSEDQKQTVFDSCIDKGFTQAEITEAVIEQAIIDMKLGGVEPTTDNFYDWLIKAIDKHIGTKETLQKYL